MSTERSTGMRLADWVFSFLSALGVIAAAGGAALYSAGFFHHLFR